MTMTYSGLFATELKKIEIKKDYTPSSITTMVSFSKYFLLGDLIVTPILQAVEALPKELMSYIGGYVTPLKAGRLIDRYDNIFGELQHICQRTDADWAEYAKANLTRFGNKETAKCYKTSKGSLYKKDNPDQIRSFNLTFKWRLKEQANAYLKQIKKEYNALFARQPTALGQTYAGIDGQIYESKLMCGKPYGKPDALYWSAVQRCVAYQGVGRCYCERCDSS